MWFNKDGEIPKQMTVPAETYNIGKEIGRGGASVVCECTSESESPTTEAASVFAIKLLYGDIDKNRIKEEFETIQTATHLHVIRTRAIAYFGETVGIIMQPRAQSDLRAYLDTQREFLRLNPIPPQTYNESEVQAHRIRRTLLSWMRCLVNTLLYLHSKNIRHRDIKPENILIHEDRVIFTDFGLSFYGAGPNECGPSRTKTQRLHTNTIGTVTYLPPEAFLNGSTDKLDIIDKIGKKGDIFSLGCVFWEMLSVIFMGSDINLPLPVGGDSFTEFWKKQLGEPQSDDEIQLMEQRGAPVPRGYAENLELLQSKVDLFYYQASQELLWKTCVHKRPREFRHSLSEVMAGSFSMATEMIDLRPTHRQSISLLEQSFRSRCAEHWWALNERPRGGAHEDYLVCPCTSDPDGTIFID